MFSKIQKHLEFKTHPQILVFLHNNADPDAVGAAFAIREFLLFCNATSKIHILCDGINSTSKNALNEITFSIEDELPELSENVTIVTLDSANIIQLGKFSQWVNESKYQRIIIDHHFTDEITRESDIVILDSEAGSTSIMLHRGFRQLQFTPSASAATMLLMGHLYDSRRFLYGSSAELFRDIAELIEVGGNYEQANNFLQNEPSISEKIAKFKSYQRLNYTHVNGYLIITSRIGAFEAAAARSIIGMGADVTLVLAGKKKELRGSARSRHTLDLNVAEIIETICAEFGGEGGGHRQAAGFNIQKAVSKKIQKDILDRFTILAKEMIEKIESSEVS
ncbi:MAG: DHH family phosphoesterase [Candidatus Heimdallarchaeota archaeon]|nr:DHH family phosphoesterase [Candidatus Heimdallarchaeota archaeon]